jgi:hypothetical protein
MISSVNIRADIAQAVFEGLSNKNNLFIGTEVMPVYSSDVKSGVYLKLNLGNSEALNDDTLKIAAGSDSMRSSMVLKRFFLTLIVVTLIVSSIQR